MKFLGTYGRAGVRRRFVFRLVGAVAFAIVADILLYSLLLERFRNDQAAAAALSLGALRGNLEGEINLNFSLVYGMAAAIATRPEMPAAEFDALAHSLKMQSAALKNIAAAPDFVIRYIYPLKDNKKALGLDYRKTPDQWPQAAAAKATGRMILAGPLKLVQGGVGLIARVPVFRSENNSFWGLVSAVIDFDELLRRSGLKPLRFPLRTAIRTKADNRIIFGDPDLFERKTKAVIMPVTVPSATWEIAGIPEKGWGTKIPGGLLLHTFTSLIAFLVMILAFQQERHRRKSEENENRLKAMSRAGHDAMMMINSQDAVIFWNPAAVAMFGYTEDEMRGKKLHDIILLPEERQLVTAGFAHFGKTGDGPVINTIHELVAVKKSGERFPVERSVASFFVDGEWCAVGSIRDISARKAAEAQLTALATTDGLTGLSNRRYFLEMSENELKKAVRYEKAISLMMFDIDHFKKINDTHGHDVGDSVLKRVSESVSTVVRETDIVGRIGGEEFAVVMPETPLSSAAQAAERLRTAIMEMKIHIDTGEIPVTVSIGVVERSDEETDVAVMLKRADNCLYDAKHRGRNRVVAG